jgi:hypothetical protein
MKAIWYSRLVFNICLIFACIVILFVRAYQLFTGGVNEDFSNYHTITPIGLAVFVVTPLQLFSVSYIATAFYKDVVLVRINDFVSMVIQFSAVSAFVGVSTAMILLNCVVVTASKRLKKIRNIASD